MFSVKRSSKKRRPEPEPEPELTKSAQRKRVSNFKDLDLDLDLDISSLRTPVKSSRMFSVKGSTKKRLPEPEITKSDKRKRASNSNDLDLDIELSSDFKGIMSALQQIRETAQKDGQKKNQQTISSVAAEIKSMTDELKSKFDKDRQGFAKALSKSSKELEKCLKNETAKFQLLDQQFCKEKDTYLQASNDIVSKFEEEKERLLMRYEQMRKKEKSIISEHEKACSDKIAQLDQSLKKKTQDEKTFSILRKTLGSFLDNASDEDFPPDD